MTTGPELTLDHPAPFGNGKVVVIGSDIPGITTQILSAAFKRLDEVDTVIGPCTDGGYYLLGLKEPHLDVLRDIPWSSPSTLSVTRERIAELKVASDDLKPLDDVDEPKDFTVWNKISGKCQSDYGGLDAQK